MKQKNQTEIAGFAVTWIAKNLLFAEKETKEKLWSPKAIVLSSGGRGEGRLEKNVIKMQSFI